MAWCIVTSVNNALTTACGEHLCGWGVCEEGKGGLRRGKLGSMQKTATGITLKYMWKRTHAIHIEIKHVRVNQPYSEL